MSDDKLLAPDNKDAKDHLFAFIKAAFATLPGTGGLGVLIDEYVHSSTRRALEKAFEFLNQRIDHLADRINATGVNEDELSDMVKTFVRVSVRSSCEEKLQAAANILANVLLRKGDGEKLSFTELEFFARCVESLSVGAIRVLAVAYRISQQQGRHKNQIGEYDFTAQDLVPQVPDMEPRVVMALVGELNAWGLMRITGGSFAGLPANGYWENEPLRMPETGVRFVRYVLEAGQERETVDGNRKD